jgi:hypothetical protein
MTTLNNGMPLWMKFISAVGVPSAGLIYLVYFLSTSLMGTINSHNDDHEHEMDTLMVIMRQVCVNTAETSEIIGRK